MLSDLARFLETIGIKPVVIHRELRVPYDELPISLLVRLIDSALYISLLFNELEMRAVLEDLYLSGEDIEAVVDRAITYLSEIGLRIRMWAEERGITTIFNLREGDIILRELVDDITEELGE